MGRGERADGDGTVLVLGATGFLGVAVVDAFRTASGGARSARLVGASRDPRSIERSVDEARPIDVTDERALARMLDEVAPTHVLSLAALSRGRDCERDPELARRSNAEAPETVARWARWARRGPARLVHVSTDLVFGGDPPPGGFAEDDEPAPLSVYGRTKADGEARVLHVLPSAVVVRLPLLFGDSRGRGLGASDAVAHAVAAGRRPRLFVDEWRTPLDVDVAAAALVELTFASVSGLLHVAGPERVDRHALGRWALEASGRSHDEALALVDAVRQADVDTGAPRPADVSLATERARRTLRTKLVGPRASLFRR